MRWRRKMRCQKRRGRFDTYMSVCTYNEIFPLWSPPWSTIVDVAFSSFDSFNAFFTGATTPTVLARDRVEIDKNYYYIYKIYLSIKPYLHRPWHSDHVLH